MEYLLDVIKSDIEQSMGIDNIEKYCQKTRDLKFVRVRNKFTFLMFHFSDLSLSKIGKFIGKDHATVLHNNKSTFEDLERDKNLYKDLEISFSKLRQKYRIVRRLEEVEGRIVAIKIKE